MEQKEKTDLQIELSQSGIEQILLNAIFSSYDYLSLLIDHFDKRWIENKNIQKILEVCLAYHKKYSSLPSEKILKMLFEKIYEKNPAFAKGDLDRELENARSSGINPDDMFVKESVLNFLKTQAAYYAILDNINAIDNKKTSDNVIQQCLSKFEKILGFSFDSELGLDYFKDHDRHCQDLLTPELKLPTLFKQLDQVTNGGLLADGKCLFVVMAQPGLGKSLFLGNFAKNFLAQNKCVLLISLEMSEFIYASRIDAQISGEDINALQHNVNNLKTKVKSFSELYPKSKLIIKEYPPGTITCNHVQSYVQKLARKGIKPDVIIIDYINLLMPNISASNESLYLKVGEITKELRALSYKFNIPLITATQANRQGYSTSDISMQNTSESAGINFHADFIGALYQVEGDRESNKISMVLLKNRLGGMIGKVLEFYINYKNLQLADYFTVQPSPNETCENKSVDQQVLDDLEKL